MNETIRKSRVVSEETWNVGILLFLYFPNAGKLIIPSGMMMQMKWTQTLLLLKLAVLQNIQETVRDEP